MRVYTPRVRLPDGMVIAEIRICDNCGEHAYRSRMCGVFVCDACEEHEGLVRCYCGWSASGGNGRQELEEMGERIDDEEIGERIDDDY